MQSNAFSLTRATPRRAAARPAAAKASPCAASPQPHSSGAARPNRWLELRGAHFGRAHAVQVSGDVEVVLDHLVVVMARLDLRPNSVVFEGGHGSVTNSVTGSQQHAVRGECTVPRMRFVDVDGEPAEQLVSARACNRVGACRET